ncbi:MAG: response regulator transcription factor [Ardenticatenaceae bacterium]|nr:response regulator transcription factor [Ardenticatenaceae bacterium]HBY95270.1 DNA-binding response regulator [Chloroflexota bacterium]
MPTNRILLVDDEQDLVWAVRHSLCDEGYEILTAYDGLEALAVARRHRPDLVILDIVLPGLNGLQVCRRLRRDPTLAAVPILFLTVHSTIDDRVAGLDEGADDYLIKPFDLRELKARVRALLRRGHPTRDEGQASNGRNPLLVVGALALDSHSRQAHVAEKSVQLTPAEFDLLRYLMIHPGEVFSSQQLLLQVWGYDPETAEPGLVRWHIRNLRTKIEPDPSDPLYIRTVPRHGYILDDVATTC